MQQSLTEYMKKELIFYIKQEYDKGHSVNQIKNALFNGGHHKDLVSEAIDALRKHNFNVVKALDEPIKKHLDQEIYFNIMNSLIKYVEFHIKRGYTTSKIKSILEKYGHSEEMIEKAIIEATKTKSIESKKTPQKKEKNQTKSFADIIFIFTLFGLIIFTTASTLDPFEIVLISFLPSLLTILGTEIAIRNNLEVMYIWLVPFIFTGVFAVLSYNGIMGHSIEYIKLIGLNLVLSFIFVYIKISSLTDKYFDSKKALKTLEKEVEVENNKKNDDE
jgi:hypothetical protein